MGERLKIFVIGPRGFPGVQGGIERFSENLYTGLVSNGYDVTTFAIKKYCSHREWRGIKFVYAPTLGFKNLEKPLYNLYAAFYSIINRPDIVHIHGITSGFFIFLMKLFRLKIVARYNSRDYLHSKWNKVGRIVLKFSEKQFLLTDHIITNNKNYFEFLTSLGRTKNISYVPNGVEIPDIEKSISLFDKKFSKIVSKNKYILYVGRVTAEKNIETLLDAFLLLEQLDMKLVIVGDAAHNDYYFTSLKQRYSNDRILFVGSVNREDLGGLYANCGLFVFPSLHEGMPNALLEAMSFNCNILASRIPGHLQFGLDEQTYFTPNDIHELKQKIQRKINSKQQRPNYSKELLDYAWPSIINRLQDIHFQVLNATRHA